MCVTCEACHYDSGDYESPEEIAAHINADGGVMVLVRDANGEPLGWKIICPKCSSDKTHMD